MVYSAHPGCGRWSGGDVPLVWRLAICFLLFSGRSHSFTGGGGGLHSFGGGADADVAATFSFYTLHH